MLKADAQIVAHWHSTGLDLERHLILALFTHVCEALWALSRGLLLPFFLILFTDLLLLLVVVVLAIFAVPVFVAPLVALYIAIDACPGSFLLTPAELKALVHVSGHGC